MSSLYMICLNSTFSKWYVCKITANFKIYNVTLYETDDWDYVDGYA